MSKDYCPIIIGLEGLSLNQNDIRRLNHDAVGGVVLFARNYADPAQLKLLTASIRSINPDLLITVDQEGGRVQRCRSGFSALPPLSYFGKRYHQDSEKACEEAKASAKLMSTELIQCDVDLSFAPVVDLNINQSVIGDRSFDQDPLIVIELARAYISGMKEAGMHSVLKHYPGHGSVQGDTHVNSVQDARSFDEVWATDLKPFVSLSSEVNAMMVSHVLYPSCDMRLASASSFWLKDILRDKIKFNGIVFSDDLGMKAAIDGSSSLDCVWHSLDSGCDAVLLCNEFDVIDAVLAQWQNQQSKKLRGYYGPTLATLAHA